MKNSPCFQFYPQDFLADLNVIEMTMEERGRYVTLLCHCWIENGLPINSFLVKNLLNGSSAIEKCFYKNRGILRNRRLDFEMRKQKLRRLECSSSGRRSSELRQLAKNKDIYGSTNVKQKPNEKSTNVLRAGQRTFNSSSSSSSSSSIHNKKERIIRKKTAAVVPPAEFDHFWRFYPRKIGKQDALREWLRITKDHAPLEILSALDMYLAEIRANNTEMRYIKLPCTFLRSDRWLDYLNAPQPETSAKGGHRVSQIGASGRRDKSREYWAEVRRLKAGGTDGEALAEAMAKWGLSDEGKPGGQDDAGRIDG